MVLLTPGPCMTSERVRQAAALPDLNHRQPEYQQLMVDLRGRLLSVYGDATYKWEPYLIGGSGTAAVEAMVTSAVEDGPVLIIANGYYSGRVAEILAIHRIHHEVLDLPWDAPLDLARVEASLRTGPFEAVVMTHDETTLGYLNPIAEVGKMCRAHGARLLVDAMSSFGADDIDFTHLDAVAASANKCLHGLPGVGFVLTTPALANAMENHRRRTYYMHLPMLRGTNPPLTPPISTLRAFREALQENPEGQSARKSAYEAKDMILRAGLAELGLDCAVPKPLSSLSVVSAQIPKGWRYDDWFEANYAAGFVIYGTKRELREKFFQVSVMGESTTEDIRNWLAVARQLIVKGSG